MLQGLLLVGHASPRRPSNQIPKPSNCLLLMWRSSSSILSSSEKMELLIQSKAEPRLPSEETNFCYFGLIWFDLIVMVTTQSWR